MPYQGGRGNTWLAKSFGRLPIIDLVNHCLIRVAHALIPPNRELPGHAPHAPRADCERYLGLAAVAAALVARRVRRRALTLLDALVLMVGWGRHGLSRRWADRRASDELAALAQAVGVERDPTTGEALTLELVIGALVGRMERMSPLKSAFAEIAAPAIAAGEDGKVLAATGGMLALQPDVEGGTVWTVFGAGFAGVVGPEPVLATLAGQHYTCAAQAGPGRVLLELQPAGELVAEDDLGAFAEALASGRTGFRFDPVAAGTRPRWRRSTTRWRCSMPAPRRSPG